MNDEMHIIIASLPHWMRPRPGDMLMWGGKIAKFNPYHKPAGSPDGGQFTTAGSAGGYTYPDDAIEPSYPIETAIGVLAGGEAIAAIRTAVAALGGAGAATAVDAAATGWRLGGFKSAETWANQMASRGWTKEDITATIQNGERYPAPNKIAPENGATRFVNRETGKYVVRDDKTGDILQISNLRFKPTTLQKWMRGGDNVNKTVEIYIDLPEEGSPTIRPTQAIDLGNGLFKVLPTLDYDPEDEVWQFPPGSIVRCKIHEDGNEKYLIAVEKAEA